MIVMKFYNQGSLKDYLRQNKFDPNRLLDSLYLARQCIVSVKALHKLDIVHRDIKEDNFLVHEKNGATTVVITDFGVSEHLIEHDALDEHANGKWNTQLKEKDVSTKIRQVTSRDPMML